MTNDTDKSSAPTLATIAEAAEKQYTRIAKDYFAPKDKGVTLSSARKCFLWITLLMSVGIMLPQLLSERKRQEVATEINPQAINDEGKNIAVPPIQNGNREEGKNSGGGGRFRIQPPQKIKPIDLRSLTEPPPGSEVKAALVSGGANGTVKVRLIEDLILNGDSYAPRNSVLIGRGSSAEDRLFITFTRLVSPEGKSRKVLAQAYDINDNIRGLNGKRVSDQVFKIAASSALIFLGGVADSLQEGSTGPFGNQRRSLRDAALGGVAQSTTEHGKRYLDSLDRDSRVEVKKETNLIVIFESGDDKNE